MDAWTVDHTVLQFPKGTVPAYGYTAAERQ